MSIYFVSERKDTAGVAGTVDVPKNAQNKNLNTLSRKKGMLRSRFGQRWLLYYPPSTQALNIDDFRIRSRFENSGSDRFRT